jgi:hypothetical protein
MLGNRRGISQTPFLIVFIILFLGACGMAYMQAQNKKKAEKLLDDKKAEYRKQTNDFKAKVQELENICAVTGYFSEQDEEGVLARDATRIEEDLGQKNKHLDPPFPPTRKLTCKLIIDEVIRQNGTVRQKVEDQRLAIENKDNRLTEADLSKQNMLKDKNDRIDALKEENDRTVARLNDTIQSFERQVTDLRERIRNLSSENERIAEERRAGEQKLKVRIGSLNARVLSLSKREQIEETPMPDGRVTRADIDQGYAYIDLGSKDGVRSGQRFHVYSVLKGGRRRPKGEVRIIRVEKDFCQCSILSMMDEGNPIVMGDYIWNKFFVPGRKLIFVFVGKFGGEHVQYTREQLKKLVQSAGHIASDKVKPRDLFDYFGFGKFD